MPPIEDLLGGDGATRSLEIGVFGKAEVVPRSELPAPSEASLSSESEDSFVQESSSPLEDHLDESGGDIILAELVDDLVQDFVRGAKARLTCRPEGSQQSSSRSGETIINSSADYGASSTTSYSTSCLDPTKQRRSLDDDPGDEGRDPKRIRGDENEPEGAVGEKLLACPYAKNDPIRYSERNTNPEETAYHKCASKILTNIPRLKQHLYRVHKRPEHYCSSCFNAFDNEQSCELHQRERSCLAIECPFKDKMNRDQCKDVKRRKVGGSCVEAWFSIFKTLFPGARLPDNPYVECTEALLAGRIVGEFTAFAEYEAPRRLAERMAIPLFGAGYEVELQWRLNQVLEESLPLVLSELRQQFSVLNEAQVGTMNQLRLADAEQ
ncbi:hypothetical protein PV08_02780 [Exophiala spinifera]|uniref:C2H2-type domain-containing protein n=1 Tax=Exophiala spinifera TaxID=91928 RepID=A0A0D2A0K1_9EURO|nr:uncharacterized protein PV08_02780 [Exophiala spinifera]KIW18492.1 hypothetical protein PV08_02780 [Exophiala spinifera]